MKIKSITATEFKAKCLRILERIGPEGLIITKHGKPLARLMPYSTAPTRDFYGCMKESVEIYGDVFSTGVSWDAQR